MPRRPHSIHEPSKQLSREEQAYLANLRARQQRGNGLFGTTTKAIFFLLFLVFAVLTLYTATRPAESHPFLPTYADCTIMLSPNVHNMEKLKIAARYFPYRPLCRLKTGFFTVNNVFQTGTRDVELTLTLNRYNVYELDGHQLLRALLPDHDNVPAMQAGMAVFQAANALDRISAGNLDFTTLISLLNRSGGIASFAGENAEIIKARLTALPGAYVLPAEKVLIPMWLDPIISMKGLRQKQDPRVQTETEGNMNNFHPSNILNIIKNIGRMGNGQ